nr:hypothetical protein [Clostridium saccharobutylicum]
MLTFHLTKSRNYHSAYILISKAKNCRKQNYFITNKLPSYNEAATTQYYQIPNIFL